MAPMGMSLEIELGVTGGEEDGIGAEHDGADNAKLYTQPEDVAKAFKLLSMLGHFSVAASFGNVHGVYAPGNVKLRPEILKASQDLVQQQFKTPAEAARAWSSTAAPAPRRRRSPRPSPTASSR